MWLPVSLSRVSAREAMAWMVTSWMAVTSRVRRCTSCSRKSFWSRRKSAAALIFSWVSTRASTTGGLMGLVM
ncbi:hypothetical protein D3C78_1704800 [compost metagenome]